MRWAPLISPRLVFPRSLPFFSPAGCVKIRFLHTKRDRSLAFAVPRGMAAMHRSASPFFANRTLPRPTSLLVPAAEDRRQPAAAAPQKRRINCDQHLLPSPTSQSPAFHRLAARVQPSIGIGQLSVPGSSSNGTETLRGTPERGTPRGPRTTTTKKKKSSLLPTNYFCCW